LHSIKVFLDLRVQPMNRRQFSALSTRRQEELRQRAEGLYVRQGGGAEFLAPLAKPAPPLNEK
jgi:hypothetical protein